MADENLDMESVRISELDQTTEVDRENDYLVVSRHSAAYIDDEKSFKITPDDLLAGVGVNYTAGDHIAIDNNTHTISATYTNATTSADGLMSKEDKSTVNNLQPVATSGDYDDLTNKPTIPAAQVNSDWNSNSGVSQILNKPSLATVATSGSYDDLTNKPTIPAAQVNSDWNSNSGVSQILNKPQLSTVATSGSYADLTNKPTIPDDLADLGDVNITSPSDDQVLKYNATSGKWINSTGGGGGGASDLDDLDDVTITSPAENQVLKYNGSQWVNATSPAGATNLDGLTDVSIASPTQGQALVYDSTSGEWENGVIDYSNITNTPTIPAAQVNSDWNSSSGVSEILNKPTIPTVNDATITVVQGSTTKGTFTLNQGTDATITLDAGGGSASALDDLTDVDITSPSEGDALVYDSTNSKWVNGAGGGGSAKQTAVTQAQYDALVQAGTVDPTMEYFITDGIPYQVTPWVELVATLTAGSTSLVFTNSAITTNSTVDPYVDDSFYGVNPTAVVIANGSVTLIFNEQAVDIPVKVRIS